VDEVPETDVRLRPGPGGHNNQHEARLAEDHTLEAWAARQGKGLADRSAPNGWVGSATDRPPLRLHIQTALPYPCHVYAFLSYLRVNATEVDRLAADLRANGVHVWLDRENIRPGEIWQESIRSTIRTGAYFVACFSAEYEQRDVTYMDEEIAVALEELETRAGGSWFLPVRISPFDLSRKGTDRTAVLSTLQWVDLWENWDRGIRQLLEVMSGSSPAYHYLRSGLQSTSDPYAGTTNVQLFEQVAQLEVSGSDLNIAKRYEEAADCFARALRIWESIEAHRLDSFDQRQFLIGSFTTHYNLTLVLFKSKQRLRASNEAVKAAKRYGALLRSGEKTIGPEVQQAAEEFAEVLMSIGRELLNSTPQSQRLEGCRVYAAILDQLADANPPSFRHYQGVALHALAQAAKAKGAAIEGDRAIMRSVEALREALEMQGDAVLRDIGQAMRTAIDSFGQEQLRAEYDELVRREVEYITSRSPAMRRQMQEDFKSGNLGKKYRIF
jgi:tetratricopeptide (TPR) repeat protein